jgi:hypothetical protein
MFSNYLRMANPTIALLQIRGKIPFIILPQRLLAFSGIQIPVGIIIVLELLAIPNTLK